jgi:RNA polymerase sigma factor (sigma-70 family)
VPLRSSSPQPRHDHEGDPARPPAARLRAVDEDFYASWEAVYVDNVDRLYRLMYARVGNRADAEDLTGEVFKSALGPLRMGSSRGEVRAYLLVTARTVLATYWRRRLGIQVTSIDPERDADAFAEPSHHDPQSDEDAERRSKVGPILAGLPDRYRRILELRFLEARSIKEAARSMEVTVSNAKVLQHRALKMAANLAQELGT